MAFISTIAAISAALLLSTAVTAKVPSARQILPFLSRTTCCTQPGTLSATGVSRKSVPTTIAFVTLGVESSGKRASAVQAEIAKRTSALVIFLKLQNVSKLQTTGISLSAERNFDVKPVAIVGYSGSNTVSFDVPIAKSGAILDGAVANGATEISGVSFKATPAVTAAARFDALARAARAARLEARVVARTLGLRLGNPKTVSIADTEAQQDSSSSSVPVLASASTFKSSTSTVLGGDSSVTATVSIVFNV